MANQTKPASSASFALFVLFAINLLNFFDRQLPGALAEPIRKEFHLSDTSLGLLGTIATLMYALALLASLVLFAASRTVEGDMRKQTL